MIELKYYPLTPIQVFSILKDMNVAYNIIDRETIKPDPKGDINFKYAKNCRRLSTVTGRNYESTMDIVVSPKGQFALKYYFNGPAQPKPKKGTDDENL